MEDMQAHMLSPSSERGNEMEGCSEAKEGLRYGPLMAWNSAEENFQEMWEKGMQESRWLYREQEWGFPGFQEKTTWRKEKNHVREQVLGEEEMVAEKFSKAEGRQREEIYLVQMRVEKKQHYHFFLPKPQRSRFCPLLLLNCYSSSFSTEALSYHSVWVKKAKLDFFPLKASVCTSIFS